MLAAAKDPYPIDRAGRSRCDSSEITRGAKILLVDRHFLIREALRAVLKELNNNLTILEAENPSCAMQIISDHKDINFVFLEVDLPDQHGISVLRQLRERYPSVAVIIVSALRDRDTMAKTLNLGALAFIPKSEERQVLLSALGLVFAGGVYIPPEILARGEQIMPIWKPVRRARNGNCLGPSDFGLTERQLEVLQLMAQGKSNEAIGRELDAAVPTIKNHVTAILRALKVTNRTEAVVMVSEMGWELAFPNSDECLVSTDFGRRS